MDYTNSAAVVIRFQHRVTIALEIKTKVLGDLLRNNYLQCMFAQCNCRCLRSFCGELVIGPTSPHTSKRRCQPPEPRHFLQLVKTGMSR